MSSPPILECDVSYPESAEGLPEQALEYGKYSLRFARNDDDLDVEALESDFRKLYF